MYSEGRDITIILKITLLFTTFFLIIGIFFISLKNCHLDMRENKV